MLVNHELARQKSFRDQNRSRDRLLVTLAEEEKSLQSLLAEKPSISFILRRADGGENPNTTAPRDDPLLRDFSPHPRTPCCGGLGL